MANAKHTPGPWRVSGGGRYIKQDFTDVGLGNDAGVILASIPGGETSGPFFVQDRAECEANAKLVAAAPELLEALSVLLEVPQLQGEQAFSARAHIDAARAVIAKAKGGQQ